jgi:hypothetical protein
VKLGDRSSDIATVLTDRTPQSRIEQHKKCERVGSSYELRRMLIVSTRHVGSVRIQDPNLCGSKNYHAPEFVAYLLGSSECQVPVPGTGAGSGHRIFLVLASVVFRAKWSGLARSAGLSVVVYCKVIQGRKYAIESTPLSA